MEADLILYSDAIFDSVKDKPFSGGIAISGKTIAAVGSREEIEKLRGEKTVIKELGDKLVMPGFIDSHGHFCEGAAYYFEVACHDMEACNSEEECAQMIGAFAKEHPELDYYTGHGWYLSYWGDDAPFPTTASLDRYVPDKPVFLTSSDHHSIWLNTKAMEVVGLADLVKGMSDEYVLRDAEGNLTGCIREKGHVVNEKIKELYGKTPEEELAQDRKDQLGLIRALNQMGLTGFSDVDFVEPEDLAAHYQALKDIENEGELTVRIYIYPGTNYRPEKLEQIKPYESFFTSDELHIAGVKGIYDGVTATYTAVLLKPYEDKPETSGVPVTDQTTLQAWVKEANRLGYGCRLHCIGDGAVRAALDAYEESGKVNNLSDIRNGIEHIEIISPEDIGRFAKLDVTASMQPRHQVLDRGEKLLRCGTERSKFEWPFHSILKSGAKIALGTDFPVCDFNPYENIYFAITTRDLDGTQYGTLSRDEVFTLAEAIKGYTISGAYLNHMDDKVGTLEAGKYADITVADRNLFAIPDDDIKDCRSVLTICNGKVVYEDENSK